MKLSRISEEFNNNNNNNNNNNGPRAFLWLRCESARNAKREVKTAFMWNSVSFNQLLLGKLHTRITATTRNVWPTTNIRFHEVFFAKVVRQDRNMYLE